MTYEGHPDQNFGSVIYSQNGEDIMLLNIFHNLGIPFDQIRYLDIGAHHPTTISNTKLLYDRGAFGVNVDANAELGKAFIKQRPRDLFLNYGVLPEPGTKPFHMIGAKSGRNTFSDTEVARLNEQDFIVRKTEQVECVTINYIVQEYFAGKLPELLLLDIEGYDDDVLKSADFGYGQERPKVIVIESRNFAITTGILFSKGYAAIAFMGENIIARR